MAKSCLPLAAMTCALVLVVGCGGEESMASRSARAFREAQQRGESVGGEAHAHGHGAPAGGEAAHERAHGAAGSAESEAAAHEHGGATAEAQAGAQVAVPSARSGAKKPQAAASRPPADQAAVGLTPEDHAAMGHAAPPTVPNTPRAVTPQAAHDPAAAPAAAGAPAATLVPDAVDAPAPSAVSDARLAAAAGASSHGGHAAGASTYRQLDAGRAAEPQPAPSQHEPNGKGPGRATHDHHGGHAPAYDAGGHAHVHGANHATGPKGDEP